VSALPIAPSNSTISTPLANAVSCQFHIIQAHEVWKNSVFAGAEVAVEAMLLHVLDQRCAGAMHDAFGLARRADEKRMNSG